MDKTSYGGRLIESKMCEARMDYAYLKPKPEPEELPAQNLTPPVCFRYELMPQAKTYAKGVRALQKELQTNPTAHPTFTLQGGKQIYRPLTFKETIRARVENYETTHNDDGSKRSLEERLSLITESWNDTCTAIAYKTGTTKFKIIPQSSDLITIALDFEEGFMAKDFDSLSGVIIDSSKGKYNTWLTKAEVLKHPGWRTAVDEDTPLLTAYTGIIFAQLKRKYNRTEGMGFRVRQNTDTDELRALLVDYLNYDSGAYGLISLSDSGSFLRVAHR